MVYHCLGQEGLDQDLNHQPERSQPTSIYLQLDFEWYPMEMDFKGSKNIFYFFYKYVDQEEKTIHP